MAISKVILNGVTQMDITDTTATAADVAQGKVFYGADGNRSTGTASGGGAIPVVDPTLTQSGEAADAKVTGDTFNALESGVAIIVSGDTCSVAVPVDGYAYIKNNTHGLSDGLYKNISASAFPTSGGTADNTVFSTVSNGALNEINTVRTGTFTAVADLLSKNECTCEYTPVLGLFGCHIRRDSGFTANTYTNIGTIIPRPRTKVSTTVASGSIAINIELRPEGTVMVYPYGTPSTSWVHCLIPYFI